MARRGVSLEAKEAAALAAGRRMIARGERPLYRLVFAPDSSWWVIGSPWLAGSATGRGEALKAARVVIAEWLDSDKEAFDLEAP